MAIHTSSSKLCRRCLHLSQWDSIGCYIINPYIVITARVMSAAGTTMGVCLNWSNQVAYAWNNPISLPAKLNKVSKNGLLNSRWNPHFILSRVLQWLFHQHTNIITRHHKISYGNLTSEWNTYYYFSESAAVLYGKLYQWTCCFSKGIAAQ